MRHGIIRTLPCTLLLALGAAIDSSGAATAVSPATAASPSPTASSSPTASPSSAPSPWKWTPEVIADLVEIKAAAISPDGRRVVYAATRPRGEGAPPGEAWASLYVVTADGPGRDTSTVRAEAGKRGTSAGATVARRLTSADGIDDKPAWSPDGRSIAFLGTRGGADAKKRLYVIAVDGGEAIPLTPDDREVSSFAWSRDAARLAYVARDPKDPKQDAVVAGRDDRPRRLYVVDRSGGAPRRVSALGDRSAWEIAWSPDGASIAATVSLLAATDQSYLEKRLLVLPLAAGGAEHEVAPRVGKIHDLGFTPDGTRLVWNGGVDRSDPTFGSVFVAPVAGGTPRNLTGDRAETVRDLVTVRDRSVVVVATQGTGAALVEIDLDGGARRELLPAGRLAFTEASASHDAARFAVAGTTPSDPAEIHLVERGAVRRLTGLHAALAGLPRARQEVVRWQASDQVTIEGILTHPPSEERPAPIVVIAHGGPEYEDLDGFDTSATEPAQALAERGFWVLRPNYRGSTGRGVAFAKSDHGDLGGRDFLDILDGVAALAARYPIERAKVGMLGGSYGGYFANLAATRYSARFAAVVSLFGISDWTSFLGQSDIPVENSEVHWALWCWDPANHGRCALASPVSHVHPDATKTPTLILQGEADKRVPKAQSDEMYAALTWAKAPVEYVVYPREEHGFDERAHRIDAARRILDWFETHLAP